jgi:hypothetical protein
MTDRDQSHDRQGVEVFRTTTDREWRFSEPRPIGSGGFQNHDR